MNIVALFNSREKKVTPTKVKTNVLKLKKDAMCYYGSYKEPFTVVDAGRTQKGVDFVEIKHTKSNRKFLFFDQCFVYVEQNTTFSI